MSIHISAISPTAIGGKVLELSNDGAVSCRLVV